eukprot:TRINITY_DN58981_c0_g1_i1.p1 TRINITY_DN58981_c0_g1~~TRINITY_DN58981_c0_g1_i1.p1  ORF type:complete len:349 (+),score=137.54 TRINITY_DN58981_c0_g1_i1:118-1164(+)
MSSPKAAAGEAHIQMEPIKPEKKEEERPKLWGVEIRILVLCLLTAQNASAVLLMRGVRSLPGQTEFSTQTAVIMQEVTKCVTCVFLLLREDGSLKSVYDAPWDALKVSIPALLYLAQNNLQFMAVTILDTATYTVSYQLKTFWTAFMSFLILGRVLNCSKWFAIGILTSGVCMVNLGGRLNGKTEQSSEKAYTQWEKFLGLVLVNVAGICSAMAGVYFEKILKEVKVSLWTRNFHLAFFSIISGYVTLYASGDGATVAIYGFFHGYTNLTWICISANAFGGLLCGAVIKYADAVAKDVSIGASIVLSTLGSVALYSYAITPLISVGIVFVIYSVFLYSGNVKNPLGFE